MIWDASTLNSANISKPKILYMSAKAIRERRLGLEHTEMAQNLNDLGLLYYNQGKYADAEPYYRRH